VHANDANDDVAAVLAGNLARHGRPPSSDALPGAEAGGVEAGGAAARDAAATGLWRVTKEDAHRVLLEAALAKHYFDVVDCDSFGLSGRTLSAALQAVKHGGLVYVTSTDGRSSAGKVPK
jgi:tRNA (guanine26-N2/guanine27-N2)-dimethyltransferase